MLSIQSLKNQLSNLYTDIQSINTADIDITNTNRVLNLYLEDLKCIYERYNFECDSFGWSSKFTIEKNTISIGLQTKIKGDNKIKKIIKLDIDNRNFMKLLKDESYDIIQTIYKANLAERNVKELNKVLDRINRESDVSMLFAVSESIIENISTKYVVFGLEVEQALYIPELYLFDRLNEPFYYGAVRDQIRICQTPAQMVKYDNEILKDLGVYTKSRFEILMRYTYSRKYEYIGKRGVGYILEEDIMALIEIEGQKESLKLFPIDLKTWLFAEVELGFK